jgi:DNA-binding response OmpR family regulator
MAKAILLLDDAESSLGPLAGAIEKAGYAPTVVDVATDVVSHFAAQPADLLFMSLRAEGAINACEKIRDNPDGAIVPILFIGTGAEEITTPSGALARGADYFFKHPLDLSKVLAKVQTYVGPGSNPVVAPPPPKHRLVAAPTPVIPPPAPAPVPMILKRPPSELFAKQAGDFSTDKTQASMRIPEFDWVKAQEKAASANATLAAASDAVLAAIKKEEEGFEEALVPVASPKQKVPAPESDAEEQRPAAEVDLEPTP